MPGDDERSRRGPIWWSLLGPRQRLSLLGLVVAAGLAVGLGYLITEQVERRFLEAAAEADQEILSFLMATDAVTASGEPDPDVLDTFVQPAIESGAVVRVKLWSPDGTVVYSDERDLIGRSFEIDEDFESMLAPMSHLADLEADENEFETPLADELLETYVPVLDGVEVVAVWEVYRPIDDFLTAVSSTRWMAFFTVGAGLLLLGVFLASTYGSLITVAQRGRQRAEARSDDLNRLLELTKIGSEQHDSGEIAASSVSYLRSELGAECVRLVGLDAGGRDLVLAQSGACGWLDGGLVRPGDVGDPVIRGDRDLRLEVWGTPTTTTRDVDHLLLGALEEIRLGLQKAAYYEDLEANRRQLEAVMDALVSAQDDERRRLVADIHDGLAQDLYRVLFGIRGCLEAEPGDVHSELVGLERMVAESSAQLRSILAAIHPTIAEDVGLLASLRTLADQMQSQYGLDVVLDLPRQADPGIEATLAAYRIAQESLTNVAKHSDGARAVLSVRRNEGGLLMTIEDHGRGLDGATDGLGMWLMRERAARVGGSIEVSDTGHGVRVAVHFPDAARVPA